MTTQILKIAEIAPSVAGIYYIPLSTNCRLFFRYPLQTSYCQPHVGTLYLYPTPRGNILPTPEPQPCASVVGLNVGGNLKPRARAKSG